MGIGEEVDLSAVAAATGGLSGAELEAIVNEAAIRAVRRVSIQLNQGIDELEIDNTVYPEDFESRVQDFLTSRDKKQTSKHFGFASEVESGFSTRMKSQTAIFK